MIACALHAHLLRYTIPHGTDQVSLGKTLTLQHDLVPIRAAQTVLT